MCRVWYLPSIIALRNENRSYNVFTVTYLGYSIIALRNENRSYNNTEQRLKILQIIALRNENRSYNPAPLTIA